MMTERRASWEEPPALRMMWAEPRGMSGGGEGWFLFFFPGGRGWLGEKEGGESDRGKEGRGHWGEGGGGVWHV